MWFLEHNTLFGGKRVWLRPGSQHLFGRTRGAKSEGKNVFFIEHKAVSRQHTMIKVLEVPPGDGTKLHSGSRIEITDLSCRQGTIVDDETLKSTKEGGSISSYATKVLAGTSHSVKLSISYPELRITWQPIVITYASRENKKSRTAQLHALDIKTTTDFVYGKTTHVASEKRNLPKVLHGLVAGTHIVTGKFLDAVIKVATPQNDDPQNYKESKLEEDFDKWWPKEKEYIPPIGVEPTPQPEQKLEPDPSRSEVFSGLIFIFLAENQHSNLSDPISGGGGKTLHFPLDWGKTTVEEYVEFVRNAAGIKGRRGQGEGRFPVVTVRPSPPDEYEAWATDFVMRVDRTVNQRSIQQNTFLDAILTNDASSLQQPPTEIDIGSSMPEKESPQSVPTERARSTRTRGASQVPESTPAPEATPAPAKESPKANPRKRVRRGVTQSRFTGFDDYEPPPKKSKVDTQPVIMEDVEVSLPTQSSYRRSQVESQAPPPSTQRSQRSRQSPVRETVEKIEQDELFPAAAAQKKRRAATRGPSVPVEPEIAKNALAEQQSKGEKIYQKLQQLKKKVGKDIDVREQTKLRMQEQDEKRERDEESLREALEGVEISEIRNLVQVEEMPVLEPRVRPQRPNKAAGDRWDDTWNGRKNFKKFRRRGAERGPQPHKVIVALEEAPPKKGFGVNDAFFLEEPERSQPKATRQPLNPRAGIVEVSESEGETGFSRRKPNRSREVVVVEDSEMEDDDAPVATGSTRNRTQRVAETQSQTQTAETQRKRAPTTSVAAGQPPAKRPRVVARRDDDDSDAEEGGFRFGRRR